MRQLLSALILAAGIISLSAPAVAKGDD